MAAENKKINISLQEASKLCEYSQEYLSLRARQGKLKATKVGRDWFVTEEDLLVYVAKVKASASKRKIAHDGFISPVQAARRVPYSAEYLSLRMRQGKIRAKKIGRSWVTKDEWLQEYIQGVKKVEVAKAARERRRWNRLSASEIPASRFFVPFEQATKNLAKQFSKSNFWRDQWDDAVRYWKRKAKALGAYCSLAIIKWRVLERELRVWQVSPVLVSARFRQRARVFQAVVLAICLLTVGSILSGPETLKNAGRVFSGTLARGAEIIFDVLDAQKEITVFLKNIPDRAKEDLWASGAVIKNGATEARRPLKDFSRELQRQYLSAQKEIEANLVVAEAAPGDLKNFFVRSGDDLAALPDKGRELVIFVGKKFDQLGGFLQTEMQNSFFAAQTDIMQWPERLKLLYLDLDKKNENTKIGLNQFLSKQGTKIYSWFDSCTRKLANLPFSIYDRYEKLSRQTGKAAVDAGQEIKSKISSLALAPRSMGQTILDSMDVVGGLINKPIMAVNRTMVASKLALTRGAAALFDFTGGHLTQYGQLAVNIESLFGKNIAGRPLIVPAAGDYQSSDDFWELSQDIEEVKNEITEMKLSFSPSAEVAQQIVNNTYNGPVTINRTEVQNVYQNLPAGNYATQDDLANFRSSLLANISNSQQAAANYITNNFYSWAPSQKIDSLGAITINGLQWPAGKGTNGQYLMTDGSAALHWRTVDLSRAGGWVHAGNVVHLQNATDLVGIGTSTPTVSLFIDATDAIKIPVGTTLERPANITGLIRFNTTTSQFEGYNGIAWAGLGGVMDVDQDTYIIPESTPGADEDILFFYTNGAERARLTSAGNLGIGTSSPFAKLTVEGDAYFAGNLTISSLNATSSIIAPYFTATAANATSTFAGGLSAASSLYVLQNGNVGIGTTTPTSKLTVQGTAGQPIVNLTSAAGAPLFFMDASGNIGVGTDSTSDAKFKIALAQTFAIETFSDQGKIASLENGVVAAGKLKITEATCGSYTVQGPDGLIYGTVLGEDGHCWLDRNLGATRKATAFNDYQSYGSLFQWGRLADNHQLINWSGPTSGTPVNGSTPVLSAGNVPGHSLFITDSNTSPYDWRTPQEPGLWQDADGINNPCPAGFRLPTQPEWAALVTAAGITNRDTAFGSSLKLPSAGYRDHTSADLNRAGDNGYYWSSSIYGISSYDLGFHSTAVYPADNNRRAYGFSVRCLKDY